MSHAATTTDDDRYKPAPLNIVVPEEHKLSRVSRSSLRVPVNLSAASSIETLTMAQKPSPTMQALPLLSLIHQKTRLGHTALNKTITARLPLCLPPMTSSPYLYGIGMSVFGQMYHSLESTWDTLLVEPASQSLSERQRDFLRSIRVESMPRSERLSCDLTNIKLHLLDIPDAATIDHIGAQSVGFGKAVADSIRARPHLTFAYAYALYLGLFNGGRWISNLLTNAGPQFWQETDRDIVADKYLSFWYFDHSPKDMHHAEDIKLEFREALQTASEMLTATEKDEVVEETIKIFSLCSEMVDWLDEVVATHPQDGQPRAPAMRLETSDDQSQNWFFVKPFSITWQALRSLAGYAPTPAPLRQGLEPT